jgi:hypothetical protein
MLLPNYKGWTVDFKLSQFRYVYEDREIAFVDFDTGQGRNLLIQIAKNYFGISNDL